MQVQVLLSNIAVPASIASCRFRAQITLYHIESSTRCMDLGSKTQD